MSKERLVWIDALRGLLIAIVVLFHAIQHGDYENNVLYNFLFSFQMPVFFAVSGFVNIKESYNVEDLKKKIFQLLIPFFVWAVLSTFLKCENVSYFLDVLKHPDNGGSYWFISTLFIIFLIFMAIINVKRKFGLDSNKWRE